MRTACVLLLALVWIPCFCQKAKPAPVFDFEASDESPEMGLKAQESVMFDDLPNEPWKIEVSAEQPVIVNGPCGIWPSVLHDTYKCDKEGAVLITDSRSKRAGLIASIVGAHAKDSTASNRLYMPNRVKLVFWYWDCIKNCPQ